MLFFLKRLTELTCKKIQFQKRFTFSFKLFFPFKNYCNFQSSANFYYYIATNILRNCCETHVILKVLFIERSSRSLCCYAASANGSSLYLDRSRASIVQLRSPVETAHPTVSLFRLRMMCNISSQSPTSVDDSILQMPYRLHSFLSLAL